MPDESIHPSWWKDVQGWSYDGFGRCIYCGSANYSDADPGHPLGDEHIIPYGLEGRTVLKEASCKACEDVINKYETFVQREVFGPMRRIRKMRSRSKPHKTLPVQLADPDTLQVVKVIRVPVADCPIAVPFMRLSPPGIFNRNTDNDGKEVRMVFLSSKDEFFDLQDKIEAEHHPLKVKHTAPADRFQIRLQIAKIAHAFLAAELGLDMFRPLLTDMIRGFVDWERLFKYVGCGYDDGAPPPPNAGHWLYKEELIVDGVPYHVVRVRLFREFDTPEYLAVAGTTVYYQPPICVTR